MELTIPTSIPNLGGSTRTAPTENITTITALAFDRDQELIKVTTANVTPTDGTSGTMTIKVPVRTRRIHFIAKNGGEFTDITNDDYGESEYDLLHDLISTELHYWAKLDFDNAEDMQSLTDELAETPNKEGKLTLIRNMAKITLTTDNPDDHIAGFLNYNTNGTIVPYKDGEFGYQTATNHDLPAHFDIASDKTEDRNLGKEHYVFEEFNDTINNNTDLVYAICKIESKYYKIAFKSSTNYYYLIRNQWYNITIAEALDPNKGKDSYTDAVENGQPINDTTNQQVYVDFVTDEETTFFIEKTSEGDTRISMFLHETGKITAKIPNGITTLQIGYKSTYFNKGGLSVSGATKVGETEEQGNIYIDTYDVTDVSEIEVSISLIDGEDAISGVEIQFQGLGDWKQSNDKLIIDVMKRDVLTVSPTTVKLLKDAGSSFTVDVTIPRYAENVGYFNLLVGDAHGKYTITPPDDLELEDGHYAMEDGRVYTFTFTLNEDGNVGDEHAISFDLYTQYHHLIGTTTVTLVEEEVVKAITAASSATSLNYASSSVEDLWVNVTVPKEVSKLTFSSSHFTIMAMGDELTATDGGYTVTHADDATETITSVRIRLNDGVSGTAQFTFGGVSDKSNVTVQSDTENIQLYSAESTNVRWQGNVPLNSADYTTIVPLKYEWFESIAAGSQLFLEFNVTGGDTSWLEVFEIRGDTESDWNNPVLGFADLNNGRYTATGNGNYTLSLTITDAVLSTIAANYRDNFLGEGTIAMAIRGEGITLTKVGIGQVQTVALSASADRTSLYYSKNAVSDLIVYVTIPAGVTTLNFESEYFDVVSVSGRQQNSEDESTRYIIDTDPYTVNHRGETSLEGLYFRLRLKEGKKQPTSDAGFTFSGTGSGVIVTPAEVSGITLEQDSSSDEYVRWQGDVLLEWNNEGHVTQIPLPYSWFEGLSERSTLKVEYETTDNNGGNAVIQFTEVKGDSWTDSPYDFADLKENDGEDAGVNLSKDTQSGSIYDREGVIELELTQTILNKMDENKTEFEGMTDIVMAIQGGNVRLKRISVIPASAQGGGGSNNSGTEVLLSQQHTFTTESNGYWTYLSFDRSFPIGTTITLTFSKGGGIKLCDNSNNNLYVPEFVNQFTHGTNYDLWMNIPNGDLVLNITTDIILYQKGNDSDLGTNLSGSLNGLIIESGETVLDRVTVTYPQQQ